MKAPQLTRRAYGTDDVFLAGEGWAEAPGDIHAAGNASAAPARVLVTFLLPEGAPLTTVEGMPSDDAPPGPVASFQSRRVSVGSFGEFDEVATTVLAFAPGAWTPRHSHAGLTLVGVLDEDMTVRGDDGETTYRPGDLWVEAPGNIHAAGNTASSDAHVAVTFLLRRGAAATTLEPAEAHSDSAGI